MYKHREKLQSNEVTQDDNVILYKEGMTVTDLANILEIAAVELVKKLMALGVMASVNQSLDYERVRLRKFQKNLDALTLHQAYPIEDFVHYS